MAIVDESTFSAERSPLTKRLMLSSRLPSAIRWLEDQAPSMVDTVVRWCQQNSWSSNLAGLDTMADLLEQDFAALNLPCERFPLPSWTSIDDDGKAIERPTGPALLWHHRPKASRRILLLIHYDTVYPPGSQPSDVERTPDDRLVGPGVADAKGGIAVILYAMQAILKHDLAGEMGITVALNPDEEVGSQSSSGLLRELSSQFEFALIFEPTLPDGALVANRKGTANFSATIRGRSAHAGRNLSDGRNAIVHAARLAIEVDAWNQTPEIIVNVGKLKGGGPLNQVPDFATMSLNVRVGSNEVVEDVLSRVSDIEKRYTTDGFSCEMNGQFHSPPKMIDGDESVVNVRRRVISAMTTSGRHVAWRDTGGACDGNKLKAFGLPNIDTMGPTGGNLHSPMEYCEIRSLAAAAKTIVHLIADAGCEP